MTIKRALISVADKNGIIDFAKELVKLNIEILSTGGTAKLLTDNNIINTEVADYTKFPEIMAGRVKTLNPMIHGGILARRGIDDDIMKQHNILPIDLVVVNLYPFAQTIALKDCTLELAIENIDIGGPAILRSSAKNYNFVSVITDSNDYAIVLNEIKKNGNTSVLTRKKLAAKVFAYTAKYDSLITNYLTQKNDVFGEVLNLQAYKKQIMRYGENSHQQAALYTYNNNNNDNNITNAKLLQGKAMSYNNFVDSDVALECVREFSNPACVIVKHANPCGVAEKKDIFSAYIAAYNTDKTSAFGGIIAFNCPLDKKTAQEIISKQFVEVIIATAITKEAIDIIATKKNIRLLITADLKNITENNLTYKSINGGLLVQTNDNTLIDKMEIVSNKQPTSDQIDDLIFAYIVAKSVKSNAIIYVKNKATIGVGAGQMSRVYSAKIAGIKAKDEGLVVKGCVMASDAFFPFRDGIDMAYDVGITAIIQPGGSIRDKEIIAAVNEHNMVMIFTGTRHFKH